MNADRDRLVELLRCAADLGFRSEGLLLSAALKLGIDLDDPLIEQARRAWADAWAVDMADEDAILEAAQQIEEGRWLPWPRAARTP